MSVLELYRMAEAGSRKFKLRLDDSSANDSDEENAVDEGMEPQASSLSTKNRKCLRLSLDHSPV